MIRFIVHTAVVGALFAASAAAQSTKLSVELNKLEAGDDACRAYLVLANDSGTTFTALKLDLVMFNPDGIVARRLAVDAAPLPANKTMLRVFDIDGLPCSEVSRLLLNDVIDCDSADGAVDGCLGSISVGARGGLSFFK